jgi:deoxycytidylate deaminase
MRKVKLFVVREGLKMSKPCKLCNLVIQKLGIKKVFYSCNGTIEKL